MIKEWFASLPIGTKLCIYCGYTLIKSDTEKVSWVNFESRVDTSFPWVLAYEEDGTLFKGWGSQRRLKIKVLAEPFEGICNEDLWE